MDDNGQTLDKSLIGQIFISLLCTYIYIRSHNLHRVIIRNTNALNVKDQYSQLSYFSFFLFSIFPFSNLYHTHIMVFLIYNLYFITSHLSFHFL